MCGFFLHYNESKNFLNFDKSFRTLSKRGPDEKKIIEIQNCKIGFHRLSIIDKDSRSMQPFIENEFILLFNGEIYNYKELRDELIQSGIKNFKTNSDTEVLLKYFIQKGPDVFDKILGMYAITIFDTKKSKIYFIRDNFGVKPLYFYHEKNEFIISSNISAIKSTILDKTQINKFNKINFNFYGFTYGNETIYNKIYESKPGYLYSFDTRNKKIIKQNIFNIFDFMSLRSNKSTFNLEDLKETIQYHLVADVNTCTLKSNGIDSNIIHYFKDKIEFNDDYISLDKNNLKIKTNIKGKIFQKDISLEYNEIFEEYISCQEYPTIDGFNTFLISKYVNRNKYKVCLSGLGLDELLNGYNISKKINNIIFLNKIFIPSLFKSNKSLKIDKIKQSKKNKDILDHYLNVRRINTYANVNRMFDSHEINQFKDDLRERLIKNLMIEKIPIKSANYDYFRIFELEFYLKNQLLKDSDYFSMQNSVELRVPFIEKNFIQKLLSDKNSNRKKRNFLKKKKFTFIDSLNIEMSKEGFIAHNFNKLNNESYSSIIMNINNKF